MVVWITGLSGAGKSTLCTALHNLIKPRLPELAIIDGDAVREAFGNDLGFSEAERIVQVRRIQAIAKILADQDLAVIVGVLYANAELLAWNRMNLPGYFEVYVKASMETLIRRDPKSLYTSALKGQIKNMVGMDIPWHAPDVPDYVVDADSDVAPADLALNLALKVPRLSAALVNRN